MKKYTLTTLIVLVLFSLLLAACQPAATGDEAPNEPQPTAEEASQPEPEPTAAEAEPAEPSGDMSMDMMFDPAMGTSADSQGLVYETLLVVQDDQLFSMLALDATVSDDGLDYIVSLRPGVSFHDGSLLNADAVTANFNRWYDSANGVQAWKDNFGGFKGETDADGKLLSIYDGIEKVDELTVLIHLNTPDAEFLNKLADPAFSIVNPDALASGHFGSEAGGDGGTGPYMISAWDAANMSLQLAPFDGYWNANAVPEGDMDVTVQ